MENFVLKTKNAIKRIAAIGIGAVMVGATMGAAFAQLENYPAPFVKDNKFVGLIVVGAAAAPADVIGATDIAATLAQSVSVTPSTSTVSGGKSYDIPLGDALNTKFASTLTASDLAGFYDGSVSLDLGGSTNSYNVKDQLTLGDGMRVTTGFTEGSTSKDWGKDIWLMTNSSGQISYNYIFKTALKTANTLTNATATNPAEIQFLGKKITITGAGTNSITAQIATEYYMNYGDTVTVEGKTVKLVNVGSGTTSAVIVSVDGTTGTVSGTTETKVNGLRFKIKSAFSSDTPAERAATLLIGSDVTKSYSDGDPYIGQPDTDYDWQWVLGNLTTTNPTIGISYAKALVNPSSSYKPLKSGASLTAPDGSYFKMAVGNPTTTSYKDYTFNGLGISAVYPAAGVNTPIDSAAYGLEVSASGGGKNGFAVTVSGGTKYTDKLFFWGNGTNTVQVFWANPDDGNHYELTGQTVTSATYATFAKIQTPDTSAGLNLQAAVNGTTFGIETGNKQIIEQLVLLTGTGPTIKFLGSQLGTAAAHESYIDGVDISTYDADGRTADGIIVNSVKSNGDSDALKLSIPSKVGDDFAVTTTITSTGTTTSGGGVSGTLAGVAVAKLDSEITDPKAMPLLLVGDSAVNTLSAQAVGLTFPTYGNDPAFKAAFNYGAGEGTIMAIQNAFGGTNWAWIVAGWDAQDTRNAATVLKDYNTYKANLVGKQVIVKSNAGILTVSAPTVAAAVAPTPAANATV